MKEKYMARFNTLEKKKTRKCIYLENIVSDYIGLVASHCRRLIMLINHIHRVILGLGWRVNRN